MKVLLFIFMIIVSAEAFAQYKVVSMYERDALLTGRFLSFKVYNSEGVEQSIQELSTEGPCYSMVDVYKQAIAHVYCKEETSVKLILLLEDGSVVRTGSFNIRKLSIVEPKDPGPVVPGDSLGRTLFVNNCATCHGAQVIDESQTVDSLKNIQFKKTQMKQFENLFDNEQMDALVQYINSEVVP